MANFYLWHGGSNTSPYDTKAKAATTLATAWAFWTSGDVCLMHHTHSETQASELLLAADVMIDSDPFVMYSVDADAADVYTPRTAAPNIAVTGAGIDIDINDAMHAYGVFFQMEDGAFDLNITFPSFYFEDCIIKWTTNTATRSLLLPYGGVFKNCTINNASASNGFNLSMSPHPSVFMGCTITGRGMVGSLCTTMTAGMGFAGRTLFHGCDLSGLTTFSNLNSSNSNVEFVNCKIPLGIDIQGPAAGFEYMVAKYATARDGASTARNYLMEHRFQGGFVSQDTAVFRDDGWLADDASTRLSHNMVAIANMKGPHTPIFTPDMAAKVDVTGSRTFTVFGVENFTVALTKDEAWMELMYLATANSVLATLDTTRAIFSTAALNSHVKAWTGTFTRKVKFVTTVTVNKAGIYMIRVYLGKFESGKTLWIDPLVQVT